MYKNGDLGRTQTALGLPTPHEADISRSPGEHDPSPQTGYRLELKSFVHQQDPGARTGVFKMLTSPFRMVKKAVQHHAASYRSKVRQNSPDLALLQIHRSRHDFGSQTIHDSPTLVNSDYEFMGIADRKFGFCWGFTTVNRYFSILAFFDPSAPAPRYIPNGLAGNEEWFRFYEKRIDSIMRGQATVIPGFANLREFTAIPEIEMYLKLHSMTAWANRAVSSQSLSTFWSSTDEMNEQAITALTTELQARIGRGELPKLLFTAAVTVTSFLGGSADIHSAMANGVELNEDGTGRILLWDANFYAEDYVSTPKFIEIRRKANGARELRFAPWRETLSTPEATERSDVLGLVRVSPELDSENNVMIESLKEFCSKADHASRYCKGMGAQGDR